MLRGLVVRALEAFLGPCSLLDSELPYPGGPIMALDARSRVTLVSFEPEDGAQALLTGLAAWHEMHANQLWLARLYPELPRSAADQALRLVVLMPAPLPGATLLAGSEDGLSVFTFRVLAVNGEAALLVEPVGEPHETAAPGNETADPRPGLGAGPELTDEESAFLAQIG